MDRTAFVAVTLALVVLIGWQVHISKRQQRMAPQAQSAAVVQDASTPAPPPPAEIKSVPQPAPVSPPVSAAGEPPVTERIESVATPAATYFFTNLGGGIAKVVLKNFPGENGEPVEWNARGAIPIGAFTAEAGKETAAPHTLEVRDGVATAERTLPGGVRLVKKFTLPTGSKGKDEYLIRLELELTNPGPGPFVAAGWFLHLGAAVPVHENDLPTYTGFDWFKAGKLHNTTALAFDPGRIPLLGIETRPGRTEIVADAPGMAWAGVRSQYFTTLLTLPEEPADLAHSAWARRFDFHFRPGGKTAYGLDGGVGLREITVAPGATWRQGFDLYVGPKEFTRLKQMRRDEDRIMNFGMFRLISEFLLTSMHWFKSWLGSYALAIIALTLCIKTAMWPLQNAATNSMKRMQLLQPKMNELREKYKDDPTRMNQELMKLYKQYGVNPFSGCLPMLIQIPIFFGFYSMLGSAIELRNSSFLWVQDLSQPDTVFHLLGFPVNILPLVMAGTMLWQMAISPKSGDPVQQRVFMFLPLIFVIFCYNFASALALYWTVQNLFSIFQLYLTRNQAPPTLQKVSAAARQPRR